MSLRGCACCVVISVVLAVSGCSTMPDSPPNVARLWQDEHFQPISLPDDADILLVSDSMRAFLGSGMFRQVRTEGALNALVAALENDTQLKLEYGADKTRTASDAFAARKGNCLSLTLMTAALASELGLRVEFRRVLTPDDWARRNEMLLNSGHVNIVLEPGLGPERSYPRKGVVIDFLPGADLKGYRSIVIDQATVLGMFMNNRSVESMASGDLNAAYAWVKRAISMAPRWLDSYNTLGVIYQRRGLLDAAELSYQAVLERETDNVAALANLVEVFRSRGNGQQAALVQARLLRIEAQPPLFDFDRGVIALKQGEHASARQYFRKELDRNASHAPSYAGLAIASLQLGDQTSGKKYLKLAVDSAVDADERGLYSAKLARLLQAKSSSQ